MSQLLQSRKKIHDRIILKILLLSHKAVNNSAPEYLRDLIRFNVKSTTICTCASFDPCLLYVPQISKRCANSFFDGSFVYAAPTLWNALDLDIRLLPFDAFKKKSQDTSLSEVLCKLILIVFYIICMIFLFLQCASTVIIVYTIISPLNLCLYIYWILEFK